MNALLKKIAVSYVLGVGFVAVGGQSLAQITPGMDAEGVLDWLDYRQANPLINNYSGPTEFVSLGVNIFPSALGYYGSTFYDEVHSSRIQPAPPLKVAQVSI